jgi:hypothetical protein
MFYNPRMPTTGKAGSFAAFLVICGGIRRFLTTAGDAAGGGGNYDERSRI